MLKYCESNGIIDAGLYECIVALTGKSHTEKGGYDLAIEIMEYMNTKAKQWKETEHIDYSVYGTPIESTTEKFAKALQRRFGVIKDVSDYDYITNSYHISVREKIDPFTKLKLESEFQRLSPGGEIQNLLCCCRKTV